MKRKILIVEDESSIVTLLSYNVEKAGFEADTAYDGDEAILKAESGNFDLIILDVMLPKKDGIEVCRYLRQNEINTPIIMLTALDDEVDKVLGLELGADDYITKPFSPREVIARIKAIFRRSAKTSMSNQTSLKIGNLEIFPERYEAKLDGHNVTFTRKEFELLLFLAENKNIALSRDQLLEAVWDYDFAGDTRIVDVHISHLREKIELDTKNPLYIKTIHGLGYKMDASLTSI